MHYCQKLAIFLYLVSEGFLGGYAIYHFIKFNRYTKCIPANEVIMAQFIFLFTILWSIIPYAYFLRSKENSSNLHENSSLLSDRSV
jgi:hypothetical protein